MVFLSAEGRSAARSETTELPSSAQAHMLDGGKTLAALLRRYSGENRVPKTLGACMRYPGLAAWAGIGPRLQRSKSYRGIGDIRDVTGRFAAVKDSARDAGYIPQTHISGSRCRAPVELARPRDVGRLPAVDFSGDSVRIDEKAEEGRGTTRLVRQLARSFSMGTRLSFRRLGLAILPVPTFCLIQV